VQRVPQDRSLLVHLIAVQALLREPVPMLAGLMAALYLRLVLDPLAAALCPVPLLELLLQAQAHLLW
jgi:hypothetical protein